MIDKFVLAFGGSVTHKHQGFATYHLNHRGSNYLWSVGVDSPPRVPPALNTLYKTYSYGTCMESVEPNRFVSSFR